MTVYVPGWKMCEGWGKGGEKRRAEAVASAQHIFSIESTL